ncbi:molybdopterin-guanine dinucleotide biosynthesis protein B [Paenochrobactrum sp. BZR 588]|uniref:molybdopterin-guanine dinucleotide biosynthesis protein B n=1 Tax=unclassified Paenochrobactrum TaxID=2639760 RepID=UPI003853E7C2
MTKQSFATPVFGITGWKNAGKTTMTERLVIELTRRGWRVSTIKHAHHDFDIDIEGTDSWRHRKAGAGEVAVVSAKRFAIIHENNNGPEPSLDDILARLSPTDLVLVEGYKQGSHPKLEVIRHESQNRMPIYHDNKTVIALASDIDASKFENKATRSFFSIDDITAIADFIEAFCGLKSH